MTAVSGKQYYRAMENHLAFAMLNSRDDIVFVSPRALPYFSKQESAAGLSVPAGVAADMQPALVATLARTRQTGRAAHSDAVQVPSGETGAAVRISTRMLGGDEIEPGTVVLIFDEIQPGALDDPAIDLISNQSVISELYADLMLSRDEFHRLAIEHEETVGNMAALNEELYSINEELRSASSELQANRDSLEAGNAALTDMVDRVTK